MKNKAILKSLAYTVSAIILLIVVIYLSLPVYHRLRQGDETDLNLLLRQNKLEMLHLKKENAALDRILSQAKEPSTVTPDELRTRITTQFGKTVSVQQLVEQSETINGQQSTVLNIRCSGAYIHVMKLCNFLESEFRNTRIDRFTLNRKSDKIVQAALTVTLEKEHE